MNTQNKYEILDVLTIRINALADAKGVDKCVAIVDCIQRITALTQLLKDEDATNDAAIKDLTSKIDALKEAGNDANPDTD